MDTLIQHPNSNNREVRGKYNDQLKELTEYKSVAQQALEKANSAYQLSKEAQYTADQIKADLAKTTQDLDAVALRVGALEDTKMKVEDALSRLKQTEDRIRISRDATLRLEKLSNGQQAKLVDIENDVNRQNGVLKQIVPAQQGIDTRLALLETLDLANAIKILKDRLAAARQFTGISISVVQDAVTNIESTLGRSKTDFKELEQELWNQSSEGTSDEA